MCEEVTIRPATVTDVTGFAKMKAQSWQETYMGILPAQRLKAVQSASHLETVAAACRELIESADCKFFVACAGSRIIGGGCLTAARDVDMGKMPELTTLYLLAQYHRRGIGSRLLHAITDDAPCYLWVAERNYGAVSFYRAAGFLEDGTIAPITPEHTSAMKIRMVRSSHKP